ncbi:MFS transporter [Breoghania sp.]|uniref:MFS transporter n=1 Tax=Breoghania sp. TaxID=2065378 RepID=UPI00261B88C9|nr:MFS transporter [Breoghania sp.]MDJ0929822.1 MFS transporter [Breoghania sp.]
MSKLNPLGGFALLCVACLTIMVGCVIVPGLPSVSTALGVPNAASWLVTLPSLGVVVFGHLVGLLMKRIGAYKALVIDLVLYGALGLVGMWLFNPIVLFTDRLLLGGATAMVMASGTNLISDFYEGDARLRMIATQGVAIELGGVIFLAIGDILAGIGWQYPFLLYLAAWVFLAMACSSSRARSRPRPRHRKKKSRPRQPGPNPMSA